MKDDPISILIAALGMLFAVTVSLLPERIDFTFIFTFQALWTNFIVVLVALVSRGDAERMQKAAVAGAQTGFVFGIALFSGAYLQGIL